VSNLLPDDVVYLAGRYTRREELCGYANHLRALGLRVEARWLLGTHQVHGEEAARAVEEHIEIPLREGRLFASDDVEDVMKANVLIAFTETPESAGSSRGGRHVEWGIGLARRESGIGMPVFLIVVGPVENVFHSLADAVYPDWNALLAAEADNRVLDPPGSRDREEPTHGR
jgi:hypothetical protein